LHVVGPVYLHVAVGYKLAPKPGASTPVLKEGIAARLEQRFGPGIGQGPQGAGWLFGRPLHLSEILEAVDEFPGVDYVEDVTILQVATDESVLWGREASLGIQIGVRSTVGVDTRFGGPPNFGLDRLVRGDTGRLISIRLRPWELLRVTVAEDGIEEIAADDRSSGSSFSTSGPA
jgi:hypothetical protein